MWGLRRAAQRVTCCIESLGKGSLAALVSRAEWMVRYQVTIFEIWLGRLTGNEDGFQFSKQDTTEVVLAECVVSKYVVVLGESNVAVEKGKR